MSHERSGAPAPSPFPFATPEFSVDPSYQALYDEWAKRRDEKASYTLQDRLRATKESPRAMTRVYSMSITMMVLSLVMLILFRRIAAKRRELERRMTSHTTGTVLDIRQKMIGRRLVTYGTVEYLHGGVLRRDEFMFDPAKPHRPGDTVPVDFDPTDLTLVQIDGLTDPRGREFDVILIPFFLIGLAMLIWAMI